MVRLRPIKLILDVGIDNVHVTDVVTIERETLAGLSEEQCHQLFRKHLQAHADNHVKTWYEIREEE